MQERQDRNLYVCLLNCLYSWLEVSGYLWVCYYNLFIIFKPHQQSLHEPIIFFRPHKMYICSLEMTKIMPKKLRKSFKSESEKWEYISNSIQL